MPTSRPALRTRAAFALIAVVLGLVSVASQPSAGQASQEPSPREPSAAAAFIAAQSAGDKVALTSVTSPLYRAEMERRGRGSVWPLDGLWVEATSKLDFAYVGAVTDSRGFTYALYTARPKRPTGQSAPTSLWRIDLDPEGKVIWGELARIFASPQVELVRGDGAAGVPNVLASSWAAPTTLASLQVVLEVRSGAGDAYVALRPDSADPGRIAFAQQQTSGDIGSSYWSYDQFVPAEGGRVQAVATGPNSYLGLTDSQSQTLRYYLEALDWHPAGG